MVGGKLSFIDSALQPLGDEQILDGFSVSWVAGKNLWKKRTCVFWNHCNWSPPGCWLELPKLWKFKVASHIYLILLFFSIWTKHEFVRLMHPRRFLDLIVWITSQKSFHVVTGDIKVFFLGFTGMPTRRPTCTLASCVRWICLSPLFSCGKH